MPSGPRSSTASPSFPDVLRADLRANAGDPKASLIVLLFRTAAAARGGGSRPKPWAIPLVVLYKLVVDWVLGVDLPTRLSVGRGLQLYHAYGLVVHPGAVLGAGVVLKHGVTIGHRGEEGGVTDNSVPTIGDNVVFGPHAQVLGGVTIGDGARIGAGAVVLIDVPAGGVAVGVPAVVLGST